KLKYRHIRQETCLHKAYQKVRKGPKENAFYYFSVCLYRNFINFANYEEQSVHPCAFIVNQHKREELWIAQTSSEKK
ncbi:hypothetical protein, partial [Phocaeicola plebeius]|uniref:hypothetical protein n=1 Tax=Phocaeicola plebeius TaxID=310297 RepID=UPI003A8D567D